jgi:hypothetical protein
MYCLVLSTWVMTPKVRLRSTVRYEDVRCCRNISFDAVISTFPCFEIEPLFLKFLAWSDVYFLFFSTGSFFFSSDDIITMSLSHGSKKKREGIPDRSVQKMHGWSLCFVCRQVFELQMASIGLVQRNFLFPLVSVYATFAPFTVTFNTAVHGDMSSLLCYGNGSDGR